MKRRIFPFVLLLCQITVYSQEPIVKDSGQQIFNEAFKYLNGLGTNYDQAKAVQLFMRGAEIGNGASLNALGNLYAKGEAGFSQSIHTAIDFYKKSGVTGYAAAYYNLAVLYRDGNAVPQDFYKSARYSQQGAALGNNACKNLLAYFYFKGLGLPQNYKKAFLLYRELSANGDANAEYFLGICYRNGYGTSPDQDEARRFLALAVQHGEKQASHELTAEPLAENSTIHNPEIQRRVETLKTHQERLLTSSSNDISGLYSGFAVYYDFSGRFVHEIVSLSLKLRKTFEGYEGTWIENNSLETSVKGNFSHNNFFFDSSSRYVRHNYYSYRKPEYYQFKTAQLAIKYFNDSMYLAGDLKFYSLTRREPGQPMYIALSRSLTDENLHNGNFQMEISPNPATTEIKANFTLPNTVKISFRIISADGKLVSSQNNATKLPAGTYTFPISIKTLTKGTYALQMISDNSVIQTKLFIKY